MQQLSGLDAAFVHQESVRTPMHISPLLIYTPAKASQSNVDLAVIRQQFANNLHKSPVFRRKLFSVPMGMDEPYWLDDKHFKLDNHVHLESLAAPGDWQQLCKLAARLHAKGLNMKRPLWDAWFINGLDHIEGIPFGSFALLLKIHHAAIDGVSLAAMVNAIHSGSADDQAGAAEDAWRPKTPDHMELWGSSNMKQMMRPLKFAKTFRKLVPAVSRVLEVRQQARDNPSTPTRSKTRFNTEVSQLRVAGSVRMNVQDLKAIRRAVRRVTFNDIAVSIVGGGLRKYLIDKGELPQDSLVCGAPVNLRGKDDSGAPGNKITTMQIGLASDIEDPVERLRAVHQYALEGKAKINALGTGTVMDISDSLAPGLLAEGLKAVSLATRMSDDIPVPFHVMVSNVPGPSEPLYLAGAELHTILGLGPIRHTMALFHVVTHSAQIHSITFTSCRKILPDY
ncbi:MAG: wax ester/triacylglycerol synthase family O-acyltransferase, partial [Pseudomonadales bacterium]